jgi:hypothetical protein
MLSRPRAPYGARDCAQPDRNPYDKGSKKTPEPMSDGHGLRIRATTRTAAGATVADEPQPPATAGVSYWAGADFTKWMSSM